MTDYSKYAVTVSGKELLELLNQECKNDIADLDSKELVDEEE